MLKRQKIFKHFTLQPYHSNFTWEKIPEYIKALDEFLLQEGALVRNLDIEDTIEQPEEADEQISFDQFYDQLQKWGVQQVLISYDDLCKAENNPQFIAM